MLVGSDFADANLTGLPGAEQGAGISANTLQGGFKGQSHNSRQNSHGHSLNLGGNGLDGGDSNPQKGSRPFIEMNGQSPRSKEGPPSIRAHLNQNQKIVLGDDAIEMI